MGMKGWALTAGIGAAAGAVAVLMMPRTNPTRRLAAKAANRMEDVACGFSLILSIQAPPHGNGPRHAARPIPMVPSVSEGLVVINLYSRFFGKLSMKGTIALPHLMRPRPESTLVM